MAKLESFAYAGEVLDDPVGIAAAIQHGDYGYVIYVPKTRGTYWSLPKISSWKRTLTNEYGAFGEVGK